MTDLITVFAHSPGLSGAERSLLETIPLLLERGRVDLVVPGPGPFLDRAQILEAHADGALRITQIASRFDYGHGAAFGPRALAHRLRNARALAQAVAHLRSRPPKVIYSNSIASWLGARAAQRLDLPHLWHLRELPLPSSIGHPRAGARAEAALLARGAHLANSAYVADWYAARHPIAPHVAYQPVTLDRPARRDATDQIRMISVGRLHPEKGHHIVLDALAHLPDALRARISLRILGAGPYAADLQERIMRHGLGAQARLAGTLPDLAAELAQTDLTVTAAIGEPFGRVTAESMLAGVPVIGAQSGGTAELLGVDGARGTLFAAGDATALAAQIAAFAADPAPFAAKAATARDWATTQLSPAAYAATLTRGLTTALQ